MVFGVSPKELRESFSGAHITPGIERTAMLLAYALQRVCQAWHRTKEM